MKKITALSLILLCTALLFSACATSPLKKTYDLEWKPENRVLTAAQELGISLNKRWEPQINAAQTMMAYRQYDDASGEQTETLYVFSTFTDTVVKSIPITKENAAYVHFPNLSEGGIFSVLYVGASDDPEGTLSVSFHARLANNAKLRLEIYDGYGKLISAVEENSLSGRDFDLFYQKYVSVPYPKAPYVLIDRVCYWEEDGGLKRIADLAFTNPQGRLERAGDVYYTHYDLGVQSHVTVYNEQLECIYYYEYKEYSSSLPSIHFLQNGNFIIQYHIKLDAAETDYHYGIGNSKYRLLTQLHDVRSGQVKMLDVDFVLDTVYRIGEKGNEVFNPKLENVAKIYYIDSDLKTLQQSVHTMDFVELSNDGEAGDSLKLTPYQIDLPKAMGNGLYKVEEVSGERRILNQKGEVVLTYSASLLPDSYGPYLYNDRAIYDLYGNVVFDLFANGMQVQYTFEHTAILLRDVEYYLLDREGELQLIGTTSNLSKRGDGYEVAKEIDGAPYICYYNEYGEELATIAVVDNTQASILMSGINGIVLRDTEGNLYKFNYTVE